MRLTATAAGAPWRDLPRICQIVLDRYGSPLVALASGRPDDPGIHREIIDWLEYSEIKCPE